MHQADLAGVPDAVHQLERAEEGTRTWPVGQVVKTEASHAFNIGSNPVRVTIIFLHIYFDIRGRESFDIQSVIITLRIHLFPFRTQKLSSAVPKILGGKLPGKIGRRRHRGKSHFFPRLYIPQ